MHANHAAYRAGSNSAPYTQQQQQHSMMYSGGATSYYQQTAAVAPTSTAPPPWQMLRDPASGYHYYYNTQTGATQWEFPAPLVAAKPDSTAAIPMPDPNAEPEAYEAWKAVMVHVRGGMASKMTGRHLDPPPKVVPTVSQCRDFKEGRCFRGDACKYAHGNRQPRENHEQRSSDEKRPAVAPTDIEDTSQKVRVELAPTQQERDVSATPPALVDTQSPKKALPEESNISPGEEQQEEEKSAEAAVRLSPPREEDCASGEESSRREDRHRRHRRDVDDDRRRRRRRRRDGDDDRSSRRRRRHRDDGEGRHHRRRRRSESEDIPEYRRASVSNH